MKAFEALKQVVAAADKDAHKFYLKGNRAAGTRLRKAMQQGKLLSQQVRESVLAKIKK